MASQRVNCALLGADLLNVTQAERFPEFFAGPTASIAWASGVLIAGAAVIALRSRLQTAQMASLLDRGLRESESRFRHLTELSSDWYWEQDENFRFSFVSGALQGRAGRDRFFVAQ